MAPYQGNYLYYSKHQGVSTTFDDFVSVQIW